ncbi:MAG: hypothetical protein II995_03365 [Oscillospiraceae bacterium]|nr:hypothetical protein [Oscillospiraceae bacterium]
MLPINAISGSILDSTLVYFSVIGMLLFAATVLRLTVPAFKKFYMPASLLAGIMGLILGPHFIGLIPKEMTSMFSAMAGRLIVLVYAPMLMRKSMTDKKELAKTAGTRVCLGYFACFAQYAVPMLLTVLLFTPVWGINPLFSTIVEQGWAGGHGTAGGMALVFEELGWLDGQSLSVTSATFGLVSGILGGTVIINIAVRKGWAAYLKSSSKGMENTDPEIYNSDTAKASAKHVTSSNVIDSMSFHLALISFAVFFGWILNVSFKKVFGFSLSWFVTAMFCGLIVKLLIKKTRYYEAIDNNIINRIQGVSLDFLIVGAVASVNVPVVVSYLTPLLIQQFVTLALTIWTFLWLAPRVFRKNWFEHSMNMYGTYTGVAAVGLMLLRMTDPDLESDVLEANATASPFSTWAIGGGIITSVMPATVVKYGIVPVCGAAVAACVVCLVLLRIFFWNPNGKDMTAASRQTVKE